MAQAASDPEVENRQVPQQSRDGPRSDNSVTPRSPNTTQGDLEKQPSGTTNSGQEEVMNGRGGGGGRRNNGGNRGGNGGNRGGGGGRPRPGNNRPPYRGRNNGGRNGNGQNRSGNGQNTQGGGSLVRRNNRQGNKNGKQQPREKILQVSGQSPVKQVAGAIAWISREGECPRILATAAPAINQAVKACAIARQFMQSDKIEISVYPEYTRGRRRDADSFTFDLRKTVTRYNVVVDESLQELKVSKESKAPTVAGAIAGRVREGQRVILSAIGPLSVAAAVRSVAIARQYLAEDGVDISFRPSFMNIEFSDGRKSSCLNFQLLAQQI